MSRGPGASESGATVGTVALQEFDDRVRASLDALPRMERIVFLMRIFGAKTQSEIASSLGIAPEEVYGLLSKSLTTLRDHLH